MTKAVPDGYATVTPSLSIKGAGDALEFYKTAFGAKELSRMPGPGGAIMHAELQIGTSRVIVAEAMMGPPTTAGLHLYVEDCDAAWGRAVAAGCKIEMPLADMFWGDRFGILSDKFGNRWSIASHKEDVAPDVMMKRMEAEMAQMAKAGKK
jgi:uncharacterized glyoxalase superfamily protein PhnB